MADPRLFALTDTLDEYFEAQFLAAIEHNDLESLAKLIASAKIQKIDLNAYTSKGITLLHYAITRCHRNNYNVNNNNNNNEKAFDDAGNIIKVLNMFYAADVDVNKPSNNQWRYYPVHVAARRGLIPILEWLIEHGARPNQADARGHTALFFITSTLESHAKKLNNKSSEVTPELIARLTATKELLESYNSSPGNYCNVL